MNRPCPFCKSDDVISFNFFTFFTKAWRIICMGCNAFGPGAETEDEAWKKWNTCND